MNYRRTYAGYSYPRYVPTEVKENASLGPRIEKVKKENLDDRTAGFVLSLDDFFKKKGGLSEKQLRSFEKIESRFSPQEKKKLEEWSKEYFEKHIETAKIIAKYYITVGYFSNIAASILDDPNHVPPKSAYERMSNNKYAQKVLEESSREPKFEVNDRAQIRSTAGRTLKEQCLAGFQNRLCIVLNNKMPIISSCKGAKRYKILPLGSSKTLNVEERHLMNPNKKGKAI